MKHTFNIIILMLSTISSYSQKHDYNWLTGYDSPDDSLPGPFGITKIDFNTPSLNPSFIYDTFKQIDFLGTANTISDKDGNYLFSYNGYIAEGRNTMRLQNGIFGISDPADLFPQMAVIIPSTEADTYFMYSKEYYSPPGLAPGSKYLFFSKFEADLVTQKIIVKKKIINSDTLNLKGIISIKHSNGRDWWVIDKKLHSNIFFCHLVSAKTGEVLSTIKNFVGRTLESTSNEVSVNGLGNKIAISSEYYQNTKYESYLDIFDFDRATGKLSNPIDYTFNDYSSFHLFGVAFSPNSKYLYVSRKTHLYQFDLSKDEIKLDTVATFDEFIGITPGGIRARTWFGYIESAPDGRIYGTTSCCTQQYLFTIDKPNLKGTACGVKQHSIKITMNNCLPTFPNYRLGPIDGSPSDSLGIDNIPVAEFRYDQDTMNYRSIDFTNLSWYEPEEFWWDWGDGSQPYYTTVWDTSIIHTYAKEGIYEVCLRAKNKNGESTKCKKINIGTTATKDEANNPLIDITLSPNPMREILIIQVKDYLPEKMIMNLYDLQGNKIITKRLYEGSNIINTESFSSGVYIVEIKERNRIVKSEKIVKI